MRKLLVVVALLALGVGAFGLWKVLAPERKPPVFVLLLDTLRADHLGTYGYGRDTSPTLDAFASEFVKFDYAVPAAPWTPPSVASIFTGMYASSHGLMPPNSREEARSAKAALNPSLETLATLFKKAGYVTAAVSPNPWITNQFGFSRGFDRFKVELRAPAAVITDRALATLADYRKRGETPFMYLHYLDPHDPYAPPAEFAARYNGAPPAGEYSEQMRRNINLYDGEIRYLDSQLARLFEGIKSEGMFDDAVIVVVGDHGEQFMEHGYLTHGYQLYNTETHVPLFLKLGRNTPRRKVVSHTVSTIDIFPTLLSAAGIEPPPQAALAVPLLDESRQAARAGVFSEIKRKLDQRAFVSFEGKKLIVGDSKEGAGARSDDPSQHVVGVFDRHQEYSERVALKESDEQQELAGEFRALFGKISALRPGGAVAAAPEVSDDTIKQLESLGYLQ